MDNSTDHSIVLEMLMDRSTMQAAEAVVALGAKHESLHISPIHLQLIFYRQDHPLLPVPSLLEQEHQEEVRKLIKIVDKYNYLSSRLD
eukprot:1828534-Ditylum_brightwellii.AAC.1